MSIKDIRNSTYNYIEQIMTDIQAFGNRIAYTEPERQAVAYIVNEMQTLGLDVHQDEMGGIYGIRKGTNPDEPAIVFGSHTDSVPNGGNYDGLAGIVSSLAVAKNLNDRNIKTERTLVFLAMRIEESTLTGQACSNSKFICGALKSADLDKIPLITEHPDLMDVDVLRVATPLKTLRQAIEKADLHKGYRKLSVLEPFRWGEFYELHIEQGHTLTRENKQIGIVESIYAPRRWRMNISVPPEKSRGVHDGTTPQPDKPDARVAATEIMFMFDLMLKQYGDEIRANIGMININGASMNRIPMDVDIFFSTRSSNMALRDNFVDEFLKKANAALVLNGYEMQVEQKERGVPVIIDPDRMKTIAKASSGYTTMTMPSGAGHDAQYLDMICENGAGVIFIPNTGESHTPSEHCKIEDIVRGSMIQNKIAIERGKIVARRIGEINYDKH